MNVIQIPRGKILFESGQLLEHLYIITNGAVKALFDGGELLLGKGDIIGLFDIGFQSHSLTYNAIENTTLVPYKIPKPWQLVSFLDDHNDIKQLIFVATLQNIRQVFNQFTLLGYECENLYPKIIENYTAYKTFCEHISISPKDLPGLEDIGPLALEETMPPWIFSYYDSILQLGPLKLTALTETSCLLSGFVLRACQDMHQIMAINRVLLDYKAELSYFLLNENRLDFFDLFSELYYRYYHMGQDTLPIGCIIGKLMIQADGCPSIDEELAVMRADEYRNKVRELSLITPDSQQTAEVGTSEINPLLKDSLLSILAYLECDEKLTVTAQKYIKAYFMLPDRNSADDNAKKIRLTLIKLFHQLYASAFQKSMSDSNIPTTVKMFLYFGYMDEALAGPEAASLLYSLVDSYKSEGNSCVYTFYDWLKMIYLGKKEPSRNEMDTDYDSYLRELRMTGKISPQEEKSMATDNMQKVVFELENMFPLVNKITFGRISSYCPVFSEHNILKPLDLATLNPRIVTEAIQKIRDMDYSAFYRETIYTNAESNVAKEYVHLEILPDVILFPNIGTRGIMWQEIEGKRRTTPSRMMLSLFHLEDISVTLLRLTGEYRWEMCKRIQGARWNDVSERSLTSEYCDYVQFYRKNNDLSVDAKEKLKISLQKAKNNYKEMFVRDYISWVLYEGAGSPRLNKVARGILFTYCPFSKEIRTKLSVNPLYREIISRYTIKTASKLHHLNNVIHKITTSGNKTPSELEIELQFFEK